jgi:hypothetical protein
MDIRTRLDCIERRIDEINTKLDTLLLGNTKLSNHITFIESVHAKLRSPINYITSYLRGLPEIEQCENLKPLHISSSYDSTAS